MKTPTILTEIEKYLRENPVVLNKSDDDGRNGSVKDENTIITKLQKHFGKKIIQRVPKRLAGDFLVVTEKETHVVNVKTTWGKANDNAQSWGGFLIAFTDLPYEKISPKYDLEDFGNLVLANKKDTPRDYWYLVVTKDTGSAQRVLIRGLKQVTNVGANPTNILQICWGKEFAKSASTPDLTYDQSWKNLVEGVVIKAYQKKLATILKGLAVFGLTS